MRVLSCVALTLGLAVPAGAQSLYSPGSSVGQMAGFGSAMAIVGEDIVVGRGGGGNWSPRGGGVHLFRRGAGGSWTETAMVQPSDGRPGDGFGASLSADGEWLAVGAPGAGAVYVFRRSGAGYTQVARVSAAGLTNADGFGSAVWLGAGQLVIGAPGADSARGAAYAVANRGGTWSAPVRIAAGREANDQLGAALTHDGTRLLVSAAGPTSMGGRPGRPKAGAVVVLRANGGNWAEEGSITAPAADSIQGFGARVVAAGGDVFVSAPVANRGGGVVYRFRRAPDGTWVAAGRLAAPVPNEAPRPGAPPPTFMLLGASMAASQGQLLVGAPIANRAVGAVHVFAEQGGEWTHRQRVTIEDGGRLSFGATLAANASMAVVGAPGADFGEGLAYVYTRDAAGQWQETGKLMDAAYSMPAVTGGQEKKCAEGGVQGFGCQEVDLQAFLPISAIGGARGVRLNDIWGWTDPTTNREYALVGRVDGTSFVDVTDPVNPVYIGDLPLTQGAQPATWRDIKVYKDHAFIVADGAGQHGMQVFDLTRLRGVANPPAAFKADTTYERIASAHNIVINEQTGYAYSVGSSGGGETCGGALHMIDIRNPKQPAFAGCFADVATGRQKTGYTHDAMCVNYHGPDTRYTGRELCFNASETAVGIADLSDKTAPKSIAVAEYPNTAYAHQGWLSEDHKFFYLNDELDELSGRAARTRTMVWDLTRLDEPVLVKEFLGTTAATDHNMYVRGRYLYQSNYVSGLRVIDIADPANPVEVGYFDTVPWGEDTPGFDGSWSNYPYFKSGTIVVSSIGQGLFVLKHRKMSPVP